MAGKISDLGSNPSSDRANDQLEVVHSGTSYKTTPNAMLGITGAPLGDADSQTVSNKTIGNTNTITLKGSLFTLQDASDTTKTARFSLASITTSTLRTYTLPDVNDTIVTLTATQTLTNKTLTSPTINNATIANPTLTVDSISGYTVAGTGTIYGLNIASGVLQTASSVPNNALSNTGSFGSAWAWTSFTPSWSNLTVGNATNTGAYNQMGKRVLVRTSLTLGTTSSVGSNPGFTLPITSVNYGAGLTIWLGMAYLNGTIGLVRWNSTTFIDLTVLNAASTYVVQNGVSATVPTTWASTNVITMQFEYEAA